MRDYSNRRDFGDTSNKQPLPYERKLKVRTSYYDHQFHNHHPLYPAQEHVPVPWINIKGYWLQEADFSTANQPAAITHLTTKPKPSIPYKLALSRLNPSAKPEKHQYPVL
jgi:hypothetical protein